MKSVLMFLSVLLISFTSFAQTICPGKCINESGNSIYDNACKYAIGRDGCERLASLGCSYYQKQQVTHPGRCVNEGGNSYYDNVCKYAMGGNQCEKYSTLGCAWYPPQTECY